MPEDLSSTIANKHLADTFHIVSPELILIDKDLKMSDLEELVEGLKNIEGIDLVLVPKSILEFGIPNFMLPEDIVKMMENDKYN